ncbi:MAG: hypothetical protein AAF391_11750 [Bacteroidota bacterium]
MTEKDAQQLQENGRKIDQLVLIIAGDAKMGVTGLVHAQKEDEKFKKRIEVTLTEMNQTLKGVSSKIESHEERLKLVEKPMASVNLILGIFEFMKKKAIWIWTVIASAIGYVIHMWEKLTN